jgi:hypothetical protein
LLLHCKLGQSLPVGLSLWSQLQGLKDIDSGIQTVVFEGCAKCNKSLVKLVGNGGVALVDHDFSSVGLLVSADAVNVTLDLVHGYLIRFLDRVPNAKVLPVLGHDHIRIRDPLDELAVVE